MTLIERCHGRGRNVESDSAAYLRPVDAAPSSTEHRGYGISIAERWDERNIAGQGLGGAWIFGARSPRRANLHVPSIAIFKKPGVLRIVEGDRVVVLTDDSRRRT